MEAIKKKQIPKIIHMVWIGPDPLPWYTDYYILFVKNNNPNFELKVWTEKDLERFDNNYSIAAKKRKKYAFATDYYRVRILYEQGGIWLDTDMLSVAPMESYLKNQVVLGFEYKKLIATGFCASVPNHPFFKRTIEIYDSFEYLPLEKVKFVINNELWTNILIQQFDLKSNNQIQLLSSDIKIYSSNIFSAMEVTSTTIFLHDHKLTWTSPFKAKIMWTALHFIVKNEDRLNFLLIVSQKVLMNKHRRLLKKTKRYNKKYLRTHPIIINDEVPLLESSSIDEESNISSFLNSDYNFSLNKKPLSSPLMKVADNPNSKKLPQESNFKSLH